MSEKNIEKMNFRSCLFLLWMILLLLTGLWCCGAVYYIIPWTGVLQNTGTIAFALLILSLIACAIKSRNLLAAADISASELLIIIYFCMLTPQDQFINTVWQIPWAKRTTTEFNGNTVTVKNIRSFIYRTENDYTVHYVDKTFDLSQICAMDLAISHWDGMKSVAHTMLSFEFSDGRHLAFSMETRLPEGAIQGMIPGMYKQYELFSVVALEEDIFKLRTNYRREELYLYRTIASPMYSQIILTALLKAINRQRISPKFYNSITHNCTTSLTPMLRWLKPGFTDDIRLLFNGYSDELLFDLGLLMHRNGESFQELKKRRHVNQYINADPDYSRAIRTNL